jgi:hypothetical protein
LITIVENEKTARKSIKNNPETIRISSFVLNKRTEVKDQDFIKPLLEGKILV